MKAVDISGIDIKPIQNSKDYCDSCAIQEARWVVGGVTLRCSKCFLYQNTEDQSEELDAFIQAVESQTHMEFQRDAEGKLIEEEDCTRFVVGLVMAQKFEKARPFA